MHNLQPFKLERYFARYEFSAPYLLSASDCESLSMNELLGLADPDSLDLWNNLSLGYTDSAGLPLLREEISNLYENTGPQQILVLVPEEGIFIAMHSLLSPGDEVVYISPAYQSLHEIGRSIGCKMIPCSLQPGSQGWQMDLDTLEKCITDKTRLLVINSRITPPDSSRPGRGWTRSLTSLAQKTYMCFQMKCTACLSMTKTSGCQQYAIYTSWVSRSRECPRAWQCQAFVLAG
jgi:hypothetical protein